MRDLNDMSSIREQIEEDCVYLMKNKFLKRNELPLYIKYLYLKRNWFAEDKLTYADLCYMWMIVDSVKSKLRTPKSEATRMVETFLDYKKHYKHDN